MSEEKSQRYAARGASASKSEVHAAISKMDKGLYPKAFCKVVPDLLGGDREFCNIIHADGSGTKSILAYLHYRETGDARVFEGIAQDSIVMNLDDLICAGVSGGILISSTINRNSRRCPGEVVAALIRGHENVIQMLREAGVDIHGGGGETADVADLTPTVVVDSCAVARLPRSQIFGSGLEPGMVIIGLASGGRASYETSENSGIGSNGLTSARHDLLSRYYADTYPEAFDPGLDPSVVYTGPFRMGDPLPGSNLSVGAALLSPTRSYAPLIVPLLKECRQEINGLIHVSGGGLTKCLRFGNNLHFVVDRPLPIPPIFSAIQKHSGTSWSEMHQVFNMGQRMEIFCREKAADDIIARAKSLNIEAALIGTTEPSRRRDKANHLSLHHGGEVLSYTV